MSWAEVQESSAFGFTVIGLIVVFGPLVAERLRLPGLLGLLFFGALIGPNMADVLPSFTGLRAVGDIGVLYLIFLAGLQLDIESFVRYRRISMGFGLLTAFIPMVLGTAMALALDVDTKAAILIGSFWASFTLITYPTLSRYGLVRNRAVAATIGASSITDTISLIVLALIIGSETGDASGVELVLLIGLGLAILAVYCFLVVPWVARWFFSGLGQERTLRYMLVLISLTSAAVVADLVGIEPLIGAFFVGVGLNRTVPNASPLMAVTDFFGNAFFIPTFLISVGLLFDPEVMFRWSTIRLAIGFTVALAVGKYIAAWLAGRIFQLTGTEIRLMFSVSIAQAAATLAATIVGFEAGLYGGAVVNAVMVVVAVSLIVTSIGTNRYAPRIPPPTTDERRLGEMVLIPVDSDPPTLRSIFSLAGDLAEPSGGVVQPLVVVTSTGPSVVEAARARQDEANRVLQGVGLDADTDLRIDRSVAAGLNRAAVQAEASLLVLPWPGPGSVRDWLIGANYAEIVSATSIPVAVAAVQPGPRQRVALIASADDLVPGERPALEVGVETARLLRGDAPITVGPLSPAELATAGIALPEQVEHRPSDGDIAAWARDNTEPGDLIVFPMRRLQLRSTAARMYESGRSVVVVSHNPGSISALNGSSMTLPVGGAITPS